MRASVALIGSHGKHRNSLKERLVRRVGMRETNVNNTHNCIHKSSYFMVLRQFS